MSKRAERRNKRKDVVNESSNIDSTSKSSHPISVSKDSESNKNSKGFIDKFLHIYDKKYKLLLLIPLIMFILAIAQIGYQTATTGDFIKKGVSLSGGMSLTIETDSDVSFKDLQSFLNNKFPNQDISVRELTVSGIKQGFIVESTFTDYPELISATKEKIGEVNDNQITKEIMGSTFGDQFFKQILLALLVSFIFMGISVAIYFRSFGPTMAVILSCLFDLVVTAAIFNLLGFRLSTAGFAAFLMLIGYSVDTDILLSTKMVKGTGSYLERVGQAFHTGMVMIMTGVVAVFVGMMLTPSDVIKQILTIIFIGLLVDIISTWIQNAGILRWYMEYTHKGSAK
jgi:preprotein translocase subunit SecF